jgi:hypothetical protein
MISYYLQGYLVSGGFVVSVDYIQKVQLVRVKKNLWLKYNDNISDVVKCDLYKVNLLLAGLGGRAV